LSVRRNHHLPALTGLRFILAIWVILHHLTGKGMMLDAWVHTLPDWAQALVRGGYLAVGTFFVLSGFVLARSYGHREWNRDSLMKYGIARVARVYPGYLLSLAIVSPFIYGALFNGGSAVERRGALLADYGLVLQGWTGPLGVGWNTPAWSLSCEFFFYLCFPVLLAVFGKKTNLRVLTGALVAIGLPLLLAAFHVPGWYKPLYHTADFIGGIVASHLFDMLQESNCGVWLYTTAGSLGAVMVAFPSRVFLDLNTSLRPINIAILVGLAIGGGLPAKLLSTRVLKYLGQASYSMYILHVPLLWWYARYVGKGPMLYLAGVILISAAAYQWFEEPARIRVTQALAFAFTPFCPSHSTRFPKDTPST